MSWKKHKSKTKLYPIVKPYQSWSLGCALKGNIVEVGKEGFSLLKVKIISFVMECT
jgi:hypothetical protein